MDLEFEYDIGSFVRVTFEDSNSMIVKVVKDFSYIEKPYYVYHNTINVCWEPTLLSLWIPLENEFCKFYNNENDFEFAQFKNKENDFFISINNNKWLFCEPSFKFQH